MSDSKTNFETDAIWEEIARSHKREHATPVFLNSGYRFQDYDQGRALFRGEQEGYIYSRYSNPNVDEFVRKMCALEHCEDGVATATGMAAMFASIAAFVQQGDHIVLARTLFGSTHIIASPILQRWGVTHTYVERGDREGWRRAITPKTRIVFIETPSNPCLDVLDIADIAEAAHAQKAILVVDNCFATPYLQNPVKCGADIVTHSATKFIDGQGRVLGGAVLGSAKLIEQVRFFCFHTGPTMSAFNAWVLSNSLANLAIRMERHCQNAYLLAEVLETHEGVAKVYYPFLESHPEYATARKQMSAGGGVVSFELKGGLESSRRFLKSLKMIVLSANLGDMRTIATHPQSTTHSNLSPERQEDIGINGGLIRISVGLEHPDDIIADVMEAL